MAQSLEALGKTHDLGHGGVWASASGSGVPAVVILAGAGAVALDYYELQQTLSSTSTTLIYDRLGIGLSAPCNLPRSSTEMIEELHQLLASLRLPLPVILIGHSLGGLIARHYATVYSKEVAGLVLLDPAHEDYDAFMPPELNQLRKVPTEEQKRALAQRKPTSSPGLLLSMGRTSVGRWILERVPMVARYRRLYRELFTAEMSKWPSGIAEQLIHAHTSVLWLLGGSREAINAYSLYEEVRSSGPVPDIPTTIFCSMGLDGFKRAVQMGESDELLAQEIAGKKRLYESYLTKVKDGRLVEVTSGHVTIAFRHAREVADSVQDIKARIESRAVS